MKKTFIAGILLTLLGIIFITIASLNNAFYDLPKLNDSILRAAIPSLNPIVGFAPSSLKH